MNCLFSAVKNYLIFSLLLLILLLLLRLWEQHEVQLRYSMLDDVFPWTYIENNKKNETHLIFSSY